MDNILKKVCRKQAFTLFIQMDDNKYVIVYFVFEGVVGQTSRS